MGKNHTGLKLRTEATSEFHLPEGVAQDCSGRHGGVGNASVRGCSSVFSDALGRFGNCPVGIVGFGRSWFQFEEEGHTSCLVEYYLSNRFD